MAANEINASISLERLERLTPIQKFKSMPVLLNHSRTLWTNHNCHAILIILLINERASSVQHLSQNWISIERKMAATTAAQFINQAHLYQETRRCDAEARLVDIYLPSRALASRLSLTTKALNRNVFIKKESKASERSPETMRLCHQRKKNRFVIHPANFSLGSVLCLFFQRKFLW